MVTLVMLSALVMQVATPVDMSCLGFISEAPVPMNLIVSGTDEDEIDSYSHAGKLLYINGPGVPSLKAGELYTVVRPEGRIRDEVTGRRIGVYHKEVGSVRIEAVRPDGASASVVQSCHVILKGDLLMPAVAKSSVKFDAKLSDRMTPFTDQGLMSTVVLGKEDLREMAAGHFCFVAVGRRDGVKPGDRFTIYRPQPPFEPRDLEVDGTGAGLSYPKVSTGYYKRALLNALSHRSLPPRVLGDLVIVDVSETTAAAKIIHSRAEIHVGDIVLRR